MSLLSLQSKSRRIDSLERRLSALGERMTLLETGENRVTLMLTARMNNMEAKLILQEAKLNTVLTGMTELHNSIGHLTQPYIAHNPAAATLHTNLGEIERVFGKIWTAFEASRAITVSDLTGLSEAIVDCELSYRAMVASGAPVTKGAGTATTPGAKTPVTPATTATPAAVKTPATTTTKTHSDGAMPAGGNTGRAVRTPAEATPAATNATAKGKQPVSA